MDTIIPSTTESSIKAPISTYMGRINRLLTAPSTFFREDLPNLSLSETLAFGIVSAWVASAFAFAFETMNSFMISALFERWVQRMFALEEGFSFLGLTGNSFLLTAGFLVLGPFLFLLRMLLGASVLYSFSLLLVDSSDTAPEPVTFKGVLKIQAAAFGSHWFSVVPIFGSFLAFFANIALLITGVKERFRVSTRRASTIVLAPYLVAFFLAALIALLVMVAMLQFSFTDLFDIDPGQLGI